MREPTDKKWGAAANEGNWTGVVGTLQHEMADFSMDLTLTPGRAEVVEFSRAYIDESLVILSSKPKPLPEYLSVIRPLEGVSFIIYYKGGDTIYVNMTSTNIR